MTFVIGSLLVEIYSRNLSTHNCRDDTKGARDVCQTLFCFLPATERSNNGEVSIEEK